MPVVNVRNAPCDVYIGRAGRGHDGYFGNPVAIGQPCPECGEKHDREGVLACYKRYLWRRVNADPVFKQRILELRGKTLGCFCAPQGCHGHVIEAYLIWEEAQ